MSGLIPSASADRWIETFQLVSSLLSLEHFWHFLQETGGCDLRFPEWACFCFPQLTLPRNGIYCIRWGLSSCPNCVLCLFNDTWKLKFWKLTIALETQTHQNTLILSRMKMPMISKAELTVTSILCCLQSVLALVLLLGKLTTKDGKAIWDSDSKISR